MLFISVFINNHHDYGFCYDDDGDGDGDGDDGDDGVFFHSLT